MNEWELNRLIEKYYSGESTEEEEKALREYFSKINIPEGFETEKAIFNYYHEAGEIPEPSAGFETRIMEGIDVSVINNRTSKFRKFLLPLIGAAAGFLILAGSYLLFIQSSELQDTFTDPEIAYAETMKILFDVSSRLNNGARALEPVGKINEISAKSLEPIHKSAILIEKNMNDLNYLQRAIDIASMPLNNR